MLIYESLIFSFNLILGIFNWEFNNTLIERENPENKWEIKTFRYIKDSDVPKVPYIYVLGHGFQKKPQNLQNKLF